MRYSSSHLEDSAQKRIFTKPEKSIELLKKHSRGPAVPFVSMIIFENQYFVEMMQYIKKGDRNLL